MAISTSHSSCCRKGTTLTALAVIFDIPFADVKEVSKGSTPLGSNSARAPLQNGTSGMQKHAGPKASPFHTPLEHSMFRRSLESIWKNEVASLLPWQFAINRESAGTQVLDKHCYPFGYVGGVGAVGQDGPVSCPVMHRGM